MLQYLVILLADTSAAYCHADNPLKERNLMPLETLRKAIRFGMKENLMIQYVFPDYKLPTEYQNVLESIDNVKIFPWNIETTSKSVDSDVIVYNSVPQDVKADNIVLRLSLAELFAKRYDIAALLPTVKRLNIVITDVEKFTDDNIKEYEKVLDEWGKVLLAQLKNGGQQQVNILTDRLQLDKMHNCDAGVNNITVAPNGRFYLCPAFYYDERMGISNRMNHHKPSSERSVGDLDTGLDIPNSQLLKLDHAPLCRNCDAYQCRRCAWLNQRMTWDINTPSRQQCVMAHLERNASRNMLIALNENSDKIKEITYLDPFEVRKEW